MAYSANEKRILGITSAAHFLTHLYELTFPALALSIRDELGWTLGGVLRLSFLMYLLYGLGSLPMGVLADRWRARWVVTLGMLGAGAGAVLVALSSTRPQFVGALALMGLCMSAYHPAGMSLLSRTMRRRGRALGFNGVFGNMGSAMAPFIAGILAYEIGWRAAYGVLGGVGLCVGLSSLLLSVEERAAARVAQPPAAGGRRSVLGLFAILCVAMMLAGFSYRGVSIVVPATFREQTTFLATLLGHLRFERLEALDNLAATTLASFVFSMGMLGQIAGGHLADRHDLRKLYLLFHAASLPFLIGMAFFGESLLLV
ncbi:MAG: MFS transporter, partial [Candidatus Krumholzibacteriia bacterium]